jgi:hypothetical protein
MNTMDENLKKKIADDFGLTQMDPLEQERMIEKIGNLLFESVIERAVDEMNEEAMKAFEEVLSEENDYQKVISFLRTKTPGFDSIVSDEMSRLKRATSGIFA